MLLLCSILLAFTGHTFILPKKITEGEKNLLSIEGGKSTILLK
jgi:hypothetical protein